MSWKTVEPPEMSLADHLAGPGKICVFPGDSTVGINADALADMLPVAERGLMAMRRDADKNPASEWKEQGLMDKAAFVVGFLRNLRRLLELGEISPDCKLDLPAGGARLLYHTCLVPAVMLDKEIAAIFLKTLEDMQ